MAMVSGASARSREMTKKKEKRKKNCQSPTIAFLLEHK
jgi:hypothetical protein